MKTIHIDIVEQRSDREYDQALTNRYGDLTIELIEEGQEPIFLTAVEEKKTGVKRNTVYGININELLSFFASEFDSSWFEKSDYDDNEELLTTCFRGFLDRGFHWPDVIFNLKNDCIEILASREEKFHPNYPTRYLTTGEYQVSKESLKEAITTLNKKFNFQYRD